MGRIQMKPGMTVRQAFDAARSNAPRDMETAPRDGTHILAYLYQEPDDCGYRGFGEWREIFWKPSMKLGGSMPWHAGDPFDSHNGNGPPEYFGEGVPRAWLPLPPKPIQFLRR